MNKRTLKIMWSQDPEHVEPKEVEVTMKRLTWGEYNAIQQEALEVKVVGSAQPLVNVNHAKLKELCVLKSLTMAPFDITLENVRRLDPTDGNALFEVFQELNEQSLKKNS